MKFKLTNEELLALIAAINTVINKLVLEANQDSVNSKLYASILQELVLKMQMRSFIAKKRYDMKFTPTQAICFWICFNSLTRNRASHLVNLIAVICDSIHQNIMIRTFHNGQPQLV